MSEAQLLTGRDSIAFIGMFDMDAVNFVWATMAPIGYKDRQAASLLCEGMRQFPNSD